MGLSTLVNIALGIVNAGLITYAHELVKQRRDNNTTIRALRNRIENLADDRAVLRQQIRDLQATPKR